MPKVYALRDIPPEVSAYGMAKYSRSDSPLRDSLRELSEEKAANFLNTFYFSYGHASIADLAHIPLAIEDISLFAAMTVVDEPLWDGQERSTRYQNFDQAPYYRPPGAGEDYDSTIQQLFSLYRDLYAVSIDALAERYPKPPDMKRGAYERTLKARAFDVARYALPLATLTSVGQITSARVLENQVSRLLTSRHLEIRDIAEQMKCAVTEQAPFSLANEVNPPIAPTLIKYAAPSPYQAHLADTLRKLAADLLPPLPAIPNRALGADLLLAADDPTVDAISMALYAVHPLSYRAIRQHVSTLNPALREDVVASVLADRGPHDDWPRFMRNGSLYFDLTMDVGAFRDFNRHRRLTKVVPELSEADGFTYPSMLNDFAPNFPYSERLHAYYASFRAENLSPLPYLLPLAHVRPSLFVMDLAEAAYLIELRSRSAGHFSYRALAWDMFRALEKTLPQVARHIRVTPPTQFDPFER